MKIGDPLDRSTDHGPQNHKAHLDKLVEYCDRGVKEGATLICGGKQVQRPGKATLTAPAPATELSLRGSSAEVIQFLSLRLPSRLLL